MPTGTQEDVVRARVPKHIKARATKDLAAMGLSMSDAIRMMLMRVAEEHALPFDVKVPNATTRSAIKEARAGKLHRSASVADLLADLNADD